TAQPIPFPTPPNFVLANHPGVRALTPAPATGTSDFDQLTWRSLAAQLGRLNLNRQLPDFPAPNAANNGQFTTAAEFTLAQQAIQARQQFAQDIFTRLRAVAGAPTPAQARGLTGGVNSPEYLALRYLAQLAVNIVDYLDTDDYSTPFNWDT